MKILLTSAMTLSMMVMFGVNQPVQAATDSQKGQLTLVKKSHHGHHGRHNKNWGGGGWGGRGYYYDGPGYYYSDPYYYNAPGLCVGPLCVF